MRERIMNAIKNILNSKVVIIIANCIVSFIFSIALCKSINLKSIYGYISWIYVLLAIISFGILIINLILSIIKKWKIEWIYLILIVPISCCYILFQPFGHKFDEPQHFYRVYDISNGNLFTNKDNDGHSIINIPKDVVTYNANFINTHHKIEEFYNIKTNYSDTVVTSSTAASYSFVSYGPAVLGAVIARSLNINIFGMFYLCKLFSSVFSIFFGFLSIKLLKKYKLMLLIILLNPLYIHQQTSISGDAVLNVLSILYFSVILSSVLNNKTDFKNLVFLIIILGIIISIKLTYFPLMILLLLLPKISKLNSKQKAILISSVIIVISHILIYVKFMNYTTDDIYIINNVDAIKQIKYIVYNPLDFILTFLRTLKLYGEHYMNMLFGSRLAWGDLNLTSGVIFFYFALIVLSPFLEKENEMFSKKQKIIMLLASLGVIFVTFGAIYLQWNPIGSELINGFQGRYLIPVILPLLILFVNKKSYIEIKPGYIVLILLFVNIVSLIEIYMAYL